jgi:hypothetical protein
MGHKVSVKKIDWDGIADELESIEKHKNPKSNRVYVIGAAFIGILLLFTSLNIMILAQTPSGFPTVIEPGSNVIGASYVVFKDGSNYYARNGTTGAINSFSTNPLTIIEYAMDNSPLSGIIAIGPGNFVWSGSNYLLIDKPGITFRGASSYWISDATNPIHANPTILGGNITITTAKITMENLGIGGALTLATIGDPVTSASHWLRFVDITVSDGVKFIGIDDAGSAYVPLIMEFEGGEFSRITSGPVFDFDNKANGPIDHILFSGITILQQRTGEDAISMHGFFDNINWVNSIFLMDGDEETILNLTLPEPYPAELSQFVQIAFTGCFFEINHVGSTIVSVADYLYTTLIDVRITGGTVFSPANPPIIVNDHTGTTGGADLYSQNKRILFDSTTFYTPQLRFKAYAGTSNGDDTLPRVLPVLVNCNFDVGVSVLQLGSLGSAAFFKNNYNLNPVGKVINPFYRDDGLNAAHGAIKIATLPSPWVGLATPLSTQNYTARDVDCLITSTGGTVSDITICDSQGHVVLTGATTLLREYLPYGYTIIWTYSGAPTVIVEGL